MPDDIEILIEEKNKILIEEFVSLTSHEFQNEYSFGSIEKVKKVNHPLTNDPSLRLILKNLQTQINDVKETKEVFSKIKNDLQNSMISSLKYLMELLLVTD